MIVLGERVTEIVFDCGEPDGPEGRSHRVVRGSLCRPRLGELHPSAPWDRYHSLEPGGWAEFCSAASRGIPLGAGGVPGYLGFESADFGDARSGRRLAAWFDNHLCRIRDEWRSPPPAVAV